MKNMMIREIAVCVVLLLVSIAILVTIHICIVGRAFRRNHEDNNNSNNIVVVQRSSRRRSSMAEEDIKKLSCFVYNVEERESSVSVVECAVCLENFRVGDMCRLLPNCNHRFHVQCIDSWLSKTAVCPICRTKVDSPKIGEQRGNSSEIGTELV